MSQQPSVLHAPFPWFGGKRRAAHLIWPAFGDVKNYVEPFAGSLAVLLARPHEPRREVVNDVDAFLVNFWRAVKYSPEKVWKFADDQVNEVDLHARHRWLVEQLPMRERLVADPHWHDPKVAGWWVWGVSTWIGAGWCTSKGPRLPRSIPRATRGGIHSASGEFIMELSARLRRVTVVCGGWKRVLSNAYTIQSGETGVFLDPPYSEGATGLYAEHDQTLSSDVRAWAIENGDNPQFKIALAGYDGEHKMPRSWRCEAWCAQGGYGSQRRDGSNRNRERERIWFSPHCLKPARSAHKEA